MYYLLVFLLELEKCDKVLQIKIILCWTIVSFICALISQHNVRLGHKPSSITKFKCKLFSKISPYDAWNVGKYWKLSNYDGFIRRKTQFFNYVFNYFSIVIYSWKHHLQLQNVFYNSKMTLSTNFQNSR
jgi:hypothetical protein